MGFDALYGIPLPFTIYSQLRFVLFCFQSQLFTFLYPSCLLLFFLSILLDLLCSSLPFIRSLFCLSFAFDFQLQLIFGFSFSSKHFTFNFLSFFHLFKSYVQSCFAESFSLKVLTFFSSSNLFKFPFRLVDIFLFLLFLILSFESYGQFCLVTSVWSIFFTFLLISFPTIHYPLVFHDSAPSLSFNFPLHLSSTS